MEHMIHGVIFGRTVIIVGKDAAARETIAGQFQSFQCRILLASSASEALNHVQMSPTPIDVILMEVGESVSETFEFVDRITGLSQSPPIFLIANAADANLNEAFYRGVEAIFFRPVQFNDMLKGISFTLEVLMDRSDRRHKRRRVHHVTVEFQNESTGVTSSGHVMNISRSGMYVCAQANLPALQQIVNFRMSLEHNGIQEISGRAIVRWIRTRSEFGRPPGFGVEFKGLDDASSALVTSFAEES